MAIIEKNLVWDGRFWEKGSAVLDDAAAALLSSRRTSKSLLQLAAFAYLRCWHALIWMLVFITWLQGPDWRILRMQIYTLALSRSLPLSPSLREFCAVSRLTSCPSSCRDCIHTYMYRGSSNLKYAQVYKPPDEFSTAIAKHPYPCI
jgi:hypothetical protein